MNKIMNKRHEQTFHVLFPKQQTAVTDLLQIQKLK